MQDSVLPAEVQEQADLLDQSLSKIQLILGAVALSHGTLSEQRRQLICGSLDESSAACFPDLFPPRFTSNLMVLLAVLYFFRLTEQNLDTSDQTPVSRCSSHLNYIASLFVLLAAAIRLFDVAFVRCNTKETAT